MPRVALWFGVSVFFIITDAEAIRVSSHFIMRSARHLASGHSMFGRSHVLPRSQRGQLQGAQPPKEAGAAKEDEKVLRAFQQILRRPLPPEAEDSFPPSPYDHTGC